MNDMKINYGDYIGNFKRYEKVDKNSIKPSTYELFNKVLSDTEFIVNATKGAGFRELVISGSMYVEKYSLMDKIYIVNYKDNIYFMSEAILNILKNNVVENEQNPKQKTFNTVVIAKPGV